MARVHDVLKWANRREVAREVTKRGYRLSGETLNRWVRDEQEFPAVVERIVFELFTIGGHEETAAPKWAADMERNLTAEIAKNRDTVLSALARPELLRAAERVIARLEAQLPQGVEVLTGKPEAADRVAAGPPNRGRGSRRGRTVD